MLVVPPLAGAQVRLRKLVLEDAASLQQHADDVEV
jgi:hypothetical protein